MISYLVRSLFGRTLTCREVSGFLTDYLDDALEPDVKRQFEEHIRYCKRCSALLEQFRTTVELAQETEPVDPPDELAEHTLAFLRKQLSKS